MKPESRKIFKLPPLGGAKRGLPVATPGSAERSEAIGVASHSKNSSAKAQTAHHKPSPQGKVSAKLTKEVFN